MTRYIVLCGLLCIWSIFAPLHTFSQDKMISGIVKSSEGPVQGAIVRNTKNTKGAITDTEGKFSLRAAKGDVIRVSMLSRPILFTVGSEDFYEIDLEGKEIELDDVFITALGIERKADDLGYVIQKVDAKELTEVKSVNFLDNLGAKVAGLTVNQGATGVGSSTKVTIRGEASFTNNNPLFVVDGVIINNNSILNFTNEAAAGFQEVDFGNGAMSVNPDDISSVSVLKGPAAAALYGTRASNGVIIITTKDGSEKRGRGVSFSSTTFIDRPFQLPRFQNEFGQGNSGEFAFVDGLGGGINDNITYSYGPRLDAGLLIPQHDSPVTLADGRVVRGGDVAVHGGLPITPTPFTSSPDNVKNFYETGVTTINNIAFSGATDKGNYRLSLTDLRSESVIPGVDLDRKTASARMSFRPFKGLEIASNLNYIHSQSRNRPANGYGSENINYSIVAWLGRQTDLEPLRDYWQPGLEDVQQYSFNYTFFDNPYFILLENRNPFQRNRVYGNLQASYQFNENLSLLVRSGMDYSDEGRNFRRAFSSNRFRNGAYAEHDVSFREINTDFLLNYKRGLGDINIDLSLGGNRMDQQAATVQSQTTSLAQPGIFTLSNAASPIEIFEFASQKRINSLYGLLKLSYRNILYLDITGRNDWSSALATPFSTENVSFFYPSVSSSLILSRILNLPRWFNFAKLRASWAQVGNDTDPFQTTGVFQAQTAVNSQPTFSDQNRIANANLLPEQTSSVEVGAELRFFGDKLIVDATYYNALTENQIISLPIAISSGYDEQVVNGGAVRSEGVELILGVRPIYNQNFKWRMFFNFSRNVATVESLPVQAERLTLAYTRVYDNVNQTVWYQVREGDRIGDMWGTGYLRNEAGDFVVNDQGRFIVDNTLKKLGNYNPDFILGFNNQLEWKNFNLGFVVDWRQGGELISRTLALAGVGGQLEETTFRPEEGIIIEGVQNIGSALEPNYVENTTPISPEAYYRQFYDRNHEENNTYDASYVKLREFSLGYSFPIYGNIESLRVSLIGRNLFAISQIPHFDPEQLAVQGNNFVLGVEDMSYPTVRSFGINVGIEF
ncbi:MAG: SusC/RagA family TonB-linked outer membrane protein [Bacteroidota bacterium]